MPSIDHGWSWVVLVSSFSTTGLLFGLSKCAGIFYTLLPQMFMISRSQAAVFTSLFTSVMCGLGVLSGILLNYFSSRTLVIMAGLLCSTGLIVCSLAPSASYFLVGYGVILGLGGGLSVVPCRVILMQYFLAKRYLALGLSTTGSCVGGILLPPILEKLEQKYGLRGALLIMSGIFLHLIPAAMTFFPQTIDDVDKKEKITTISSETENKQFNSLNGHTQNTENNSLNDQNKQKCSCPLDLSVLVNFHFILIACSNFCTAVGFTSVNLCFPDFALTESTESISRSQAAFLLSGLAGGDLCGRVFTSFISAKLKLKYLLMGDAFCTMLIIIAIPVFRQYIGLLVCAWVYGVFSGVLNVTPNLLINEYLPPTSWASSFGFLSMFISLPIISVAPVVANIRDFTGSYTYCFQVAGIVNGCAVLPWILETILQRRNKRDVYWVESKKVLPICNHSEALRVSFSM